MNIGPKLSRFFLREELVHDTSANTLELSNLGKLKSISRLHTRRDSKLEKSSCQSESSELPISIISAESHLFQIMKLSKQIEDEEERKICHNLTSKVIKINREPIIQQKLHELFELYIKQQILKHYCQKFNCKAKISSQIKKILTPIFQLIFGQNQSYLDRFQPYLKSLSIKYLIHTPMDTYTRYSPEHLLLQIAETWIKIRQLQTNLKKVMKTQLKQCLLSFCEWKNDKIYLDRRALYHRMQLKTQEIRMVRLIKIFIFSFKVHGESSQRRGLEQWLQSP